MPKVTYPGGANGSVGRYSKGQSILVDSFEKKRNLGKSMSKIAQKGKSSQKILKNLSNTAGRKKQGFTEDSSTVDSFPGLSQEWADPSTGLIHEWTDPP